MANRPFRRSQAIAPFGVGAMIDFPGPVSLIHCGLDAWPFRADDPAHREFKIEDDRRLLDRLGVQYLVSPPDYRYPRIGEEGGRPNQNLKIPFLRFPRWHVCPRCGRMFEAALHDQMPPECFGPVATGKEKGKPHPRRKTIQVRFVAACEHGHLQDFPWWEWLFRSSTQPGTGRLRMNTSGSSSLAGVRIICEENTDAIRIIRSGTLSGAFDFESGQASPLSRIEVFCRGDNPALGIPSAISSPPGCGKQLYPLLRGGTNIYFPHIVSSIYVPPRDSQVPEEALEILEDSVVWGFLSMSAQAAPDRKVGVGIAGIVLRTYYPQAQISPELLAEAANRRLEGNTARTAAPIQVEETEQTYRREEYELFRRDVHDGYPKTNLLIRISPIGNYGTVVRDYFEKISLAHKLRETRAFVGFSRIFPGNDLDDREKRNLIWRTQKEWLPAVVVRGEGIFLQLSEEKIRTWLSSIGDKPDRRLGTIRGTFDQLRQRRHQEPKRVTTRFVLLHTLSHMLINQLIYECGYGSASLRERLYCADGENPMSGILIYTAAGDSEGTMGGLVRMGLPGRFEEVFLRGLERARWCSTDPVCIESPGQGPDNCNLAACHACALLPETSCEEQNRLLDRGVVIGTLQLPEIGFFKDLL